MTVRGLAVIDRRRQALGAPLDWRRDLLDDLGGEKAASAQQKALAEAAVRTRLSVNPVDAWLMAHGSRIGPPSRRESGVTHSPEERALSLFHQQAGQDLSAFGGNLDKSGLAVAD